MSERATPLRVVNEIPRIVQLQKALDAEKALIEQNMIKDLFAILARLEEATEQASKPKIAEAWRNLRAGVEVTLEIVCRCRS